MSAWSNVEEFTDTDTVYLKKAVFICGENAKY